MSAIKCRRFTVTVSTCNVKKGKAALVAVIVKLTSRNRIEKIGRSKSSIKGPSPVIYLRPGKVQGSESYADITSTYILKMSGK